MFELIGRNATFAQWLLAQSDPAPAIGKWFYFVVAIGGLGAFLCAQGLGQSKGGKSLFAIGAVMLVAALGLDATTYPPTIERCILLAFGWLATFGAIGFISFRQPVHAALGFAVAVLSACGVFMLLSAPFLAAATTIIYAGATIIIFLFVLMFASNRHLQTYEIRLASPWLAVAVSTVLVALLLTALRTMPVLPASEVAASNVGDLGRSLFTEYLWSVELAGTLLLVATVGAIVIAQRVEPSKSNDPLNETASFSASQGSNEGAPS